MMNRISNSARVHLSLDPTYHELGTLSTPIYTTTESEHHKVKGYLGPIYPSQRQNLLPTLEISNQNFQNFQNFGIKFQNLEFYSKISKPQRGRQ